jgi:hypothetical protein
MASRTQLDAYERAARASLAAREGPAVAPVARLNDKQLVALFSIRTRKSLVAPFESRAVACGEAKKEQS